MSSQQGVCSDALQVCSHALGRVQEQDHVLPCPLTAGRRVNIDGAEVDAPARNAVA